MDNIRKQVRVALAEHGVSLVGVCRASGLPYSRTVRVVHGFAKPRPGEVETLLSAIESGRP